MIQADWPAHFLKRESLVTDFLPADRAIGRLLKEAGVISDLPSPLSECRFHADRVVTDGERIDLGDGIVWQVLSTPGHSPCHTSFYEEREDVLVLGDATGFYDPEREVFWPNYFFSLEQYCSSICTMMYLPARVGLLAHNGAIKGLVGEYLTRALMATEEYHQEMLERLSSDRDHERICREKADWVCTLGPLASYKAIVFLCSLLLKRSGKEKGKAQFSLPGAVAA